MEMLQIISFYAYSQRQMRLIVADLPRSKQADQLSVTLGLANVTQTLEHTKYLLRRRLT